MSSKNAKLNNYSIDEYSKFGSKFIFRKYHISNSRRIYYYLINYTLQEAIDVMPGEMSQHDNDSIDADAIERGERTILRIFPD